MEITASEIRNPKRLDTVLKYMKTTGKAVPLTRRGRVVAFITPAAEPQPAPLRQTGDGR